MYPFQSINCTYFLDSELDISTKPKFILNPAKDYGRDGLENKGSLWSAPTHNVDEENKNSAVNCICVYCMSKVISYVRNIP